MSRILDKQLVTTNGRDLADAQASLTIEAPPNRTSHIDAERSNGHGPAELPAPPDIDAERPDNDAEQPGYDPGAKVIKFSHVSKRFTLHQERPRSFQEMLTSRFGRGRKLAVAPPELAPQNKEFWALRDVNFSVYAGEALGIVGENGSGKSTTLKLISKILFANEGSVSVKGKVSALLELGTGFHQDLTGRENIYLNGSLLGISRRDMASRYNDIVAFSELERFIDTPIKHWSSGMVMRLGFAVAINVEPDILITDEVLAVGDESFQRKCIEQIARFRRAGKTIIFVSHALEAVRSLCTRVIWLEHGVLRADGPAGQVIDMYLEYANERHRRRLHDEYVAEHNGLTPAESETDFTPLAVVETAGAEEQEPGAPPSVIRPGARWGTGAATITGLTFLDAAKKPTAVFTTGASATLRIFYKSPRRIEHPVFGLAIYSEGGLHLTGPNTRFAGYDVPAIEGEGYIDYTMPNLPLLPGVYDVTAALTSADMLEMYDHQHRLYNFVVQPNSALPERFGTVYIPGEWSGEA